MGSEERKIVKKTQNELCEKGFENDRPAEYYKLIL